MLKSDQRLNNTIIGYVPCPHCDGPVVFVKLSAVIAKNNGELMTGIHFKDANERELPSDCDSPRMCTNCGAQDMNIMSRVENLKMVVNEQWLKTHKQNKVWELVKKYA